VRACLKFRAGRFPITAHHGGYRDSLVKTARQVPIVAQGGPSWAQYMWQQRQSWSVCARFQDWAHLWSETTVPMHPHSHRALADHFSISVQFFPQVALDFFCQHYSPSNLAESQNSHPTCVRSWCTWRARCVAVFQKNKSGPSDSQGFYFEPTVGGKTRIFGVLQQHTQTQTVVWVCVWNKKVTVPPRTFRPLPTMVAMTDSESAGAPPGEVAAWEGVRRGLPACVASHDPATSDLLPLPQLSTAHTHNMSHPHHFLSVDTMYSSSTFTLIICETTPGTLHMHEQHCITTHPHGQEFPDLPPLSPAPPFCILFVRMKSHASSPPFCLRSFVLDLIFWRWFSQV